MDLTGGGATAAGGIEINLLDLSEGFVVASADLPSGRYNQARIFFTDATIVFSDVVVYTARIVVTREVAQSI